MTPRIRSLLLALGAEFAAERIRGEIRLMPHSSDFFDETRREGLMAFVEDIGGSRQRYAYIPLDDARPPHVIESCEAQCGQLTVSTQCTREATPQDVARVQSDGTESERFMSARVEG